MNQTKPETCEWCHVSEYLALSEGPGRVVGAVARSIMGVYVPLPDDFKFWWCTKCNHRCMTDELKEAFLAVEKASFVERKGA